VGAVVVQVQRVQDAPEFQTGNYLGPTWWGNR
jgi:hypothetical protein